MEEIELLTQDLPSLDFVLKLSFYVLVGFFALFAGILYYHWTNYATDKTVTQITLISFIVLTVPLLLLMGSIVLVM